MPAIRSSSFELGVCSQGIIQRRLPGQMERAANLRSFSGNSSLDHQIPGSPFCRDEALAPGGNSLGDAVTPLQMEEVDGGLAGRLASKPVFSRIGWARNVRCNWLTKTVQCENVTIGNSDLAP